jgi:hypothetical protein
MAPRNGGVRIDLDDLPVARRGDPSAAADLVLALPFPGEPNCNRSQHPTKEHRCAGYHYWHRLTRVIITHDKCTDTGEGLS